MARINDVQIALSREGTLPEDRLQALLDFELEFASSESNSGRPFTLFIAITDIEAARHAHPDQILQAPYGFDKHRHIHDCYFRTRYGNYELLIVLAPAESQYAQTAVHPTAVYSHPDSGPPSAGYQTAHTQPPTGMSNGMYSPSQNGQAQHGPFGRIGSRETGPRPAPASDYRHQTTTREQPPLEDGFTLLSIREMVAPTGYPRMPVQRRFVIPRRDGQLSASVQTDPAYGRPSYESQTTPSQTWAHPNIHTHAPTSPGYASPGGSDDPAVQAPTRMRVSHTFRILESDRSVEAWLQLPAHQLQTSTLLDLVAPHSRKLLLEQVCRLWESPQTPQQLHVDWLKGNGQPESGQITLRAVPAPEHRTPGGLEFEVLQQRPDTLVSPKDTGTNERLQNMVENSPVGICVTDSQGYFKFVNPAYYRIYGYDASELIGEHFVKVVPTHQADHWRKVHDRFIAGAEHTRGEFDVVGKGGRPITVLADSARVTDEGGQPMKITFVQDISERKQMEVRLQSSEERQRRMIDTAPVGICITKADGTFETVNETYCRIYRYEPHELIGKHFTLVTRKEDEAYWQRKHDQFIDGRDETRGEFTVVDKYGKQLTILADSTRITGEDGQPRKVTFVVDITARKEAEHELQTVQEELRQNLEEMEATQTQMKDQQREIQSSERRFRMLLEQAPIGICVTDEHGFYESVNDSYCAVFGYRPEELIGEHFTMTVPKDKVAFWRERHDAFIRGEDDTRGEILMIDKNGRVMTVYSDATRISGADGRPRKVTFILDMTERKKMERSLKRSEESLTHLINTAPMGIAVINARGEYESVNTAFAKIYGYESEEFIGQPFTMTLPSGQQEFWQQTHQRFIEGETEYRGELNELDKRGRNLTILTDAVRIVGNDGQPKRVTFVVDITNRKKNEQELKRSEERLTSLIQSAPFGISIVDEGGHYESVNEVYCRIYGYHREELIGQPFTVVVPADKAQYWQERHSRFLNGETESREEFEVLTKQGKRISVLSDAVLVTGSDGRPRKVTFVVDMTERKQAEQELEKLSLVASRTDNVVIISDAEGGIEWVNEAFERLTEFRFEDVRGQKPGSFLQGKDTDPETVAEIRRALAVPEAVDVDILNYTKSGTPYWINLNITPIFGPQRQVEKFIAIERDITESKATEAELQKLSLVASKTDNVVIISDAEGGIEWVNEAFERLTEFRIEDVRGQKPGSFLQGKDTDPETVATIRRALAVPEAVDVDILNYTKSGTSYWINLNITPILDHEGRVEKYIAVERDITRSKEVEQEIKEANSRLSNTLDELQATQNQLINSEKMAALGQLISGVAHEVNTPISAVKASIRNMFRMLPDTLSELPALFQKIPKNHINLFRDLMESAITSGQVYSTIEERQFRNKLTDMLEDEMVENAEDIASIMVEAGIVENVEKYIPLLKGKHNMEVVDMVYKFGQLKVSMGNIDLASDKTSKIVAALKNYSYVQSSDRLVDTDIATSLDTVLTLLHNQTKYGIQVVRNYDEHLPPVPVYPDELAQVWTNIIQNGVQAMKGEGTLTLDILDADPMVTVRISDSGPGIPENIIDRIFEPFFTTKGQGEGTGLGLDICRKIIEKHNGALTVDSEPGRTTFIINLPKVQQQVEAAEAVASQT